jgi:hypothetical protein
MDCGPVIPPNAGQQDWVLIADTGCLLRRAAAPADKPAATTIVRRRAYIRRPTPGATDDGSRPGKVVARLALFKSVKDNYGPGSLGGAVCRLKARANQGTKQDSARKRSAVLARSSQAAFAAGPHFCNSELSLRSTLSARRCTLYRPKPIRMHRSHIDGGISSIVYSLRQSAVRTPCEAAFAGGGWFACPAKLQVSRKQPSVRTPTPTAALIATRDESRSMSNFAQTCLGIWPMLGEDATPWPCPCIAPSEKSL